MRMRADVRGSVRVYRVELTRTTQIVHVEGSITTIIINSNNTTVLALRPRQQRPSVEYMQRVCCVCVCRESVPAKVLSRMYIISSVESAKGSTTGAGAGMARGTTTGTGRGLTMGSGILTGTGKGWFHRLRSWLESCGAVVVECGGGVGRRRTRVE